MPTAPVPSIDWYARNPLVAGDRRRRDAATPWERSFACEDVRPLIVCRGPIRKEALDVFAEMGIPHAGILLSEKDSIVYPQALAPELRQVHPDHVHRVKDYSGATREERQQRMRQIVELCHAHGYTHVFAGYGFMAEDEEFVRTLEEGGVGFIGPRSSVQAAAGAKDQAKRTALRERVSVTPGIDDATARLVMRKYPGRFADRYAADAWLASEYAAGRDPYTIDELGEEIVRCADELFASHPGRRVRLKAIGGGGGKGQRILHGSSEGAAAALREILAEVKATGVGDNKNVLLELNVEHTRHNEIQLLGNGAWCIALGGRDCSVQMHEQKLLEVSITQEGLAGAIAEQKAQGREPAARALQADLATLAAMEAEAERFGAAVGLNSASTFECIVEGDHHYFMEVNTRIQVEHRVSELCYGLRFRNPDAPHEHFDVHSIVEAMVLLARHGERLPRPERFLREGAAVEARLNATDRSLAPHAGGLITSWTDAIEHEIRDDQGISQKNPDTGGFVPYRLAGAYDSNVALLVTTGADRRQSYERLSEILRRTKLLGPDLQTNNAFHYGLVEWFLSHGVWAKPTTRFVVPWLTQVGLLHEVAHQLDVGHAWAKILEAYEARRKAAGGTPEATKAAIAGTLRILHLKETLLKRPFDVLFDEPHVLAGWLARNRTRFSLDGGRVRWLANPLRVLADTYAFLNMDWRPDVPAAHVIWKHDHELLDAALAFYGRLDARLGTTPADWASVEAALATAAPPAGFDEALWGRVRAAHAGYMAGMEMFDLLPLIGHRAGFFELRVDDALEVVIPERLLDRALQERMKKVLVPPPVTRSNEIVAASGGMFYAQEAPHLPPFVKPGSHFQKGDPLYIVEVMKMFNKVYATFSGTVDAVLVEGGEGTIVQKGQPLYRVTPDEALVEEDPKARAKRFREVTASFLDAIL